MTEGRICAYCCRDHEVHGGCFTGKKPSELKAERELLATRPSPARDEGAGTMGRGEVLSIIEDALNSAIPEPWEVAQHATDRILALAAPVSAPGMDREEARAQVIIAALGVLDGWHDGNRERKAIDIAEAVTAALFGQEVTAPADGALEASSTLGTGGPIPSTPPFIQWNGGENPAADVGGRCGNKKLPGGCPLNNVQCDYPRCDRIIPTDTETGGPS